MINFKIFTIFPELFPQILANSITGEALNKNLWKLEVINIRDYGFDARKTVDDAPFGGGAGMVFRPDVLYSALDKNIIKNYLKRSPEMGLMSVLEIVFSEEIFWLIHSLLINM